MIRSRRPIEVLPIQNDDFWKWTNISLVSTAAKLKALGINPAFLNSGPIDIDYEMELLQLQADYEEFFGDQDTQD